MKRYSTFSLVVIIIISILLIIFGCNKNDVLSPEKLSINYLSFESKGCSTLNKLSQIIDDVAILEWQYVNSNLEVVISFSTHCSAKMKDSVSLSDKIINIFLADTNKVAAKCSCPHKEVFNFEVRDENEILLLFNYKAYSKTEYSLLADSAITINPAFP